MKLPLLCAAYLLLHLFTTGITTPTPSDACRRSTNASKSRRASYSNSHALAVHGLLHPHHRRQQQPARLVARSINWHGVAQHAVYAVPSAAAAYLAWRLRRAEAAAKAALKAAQQADVETNRLRGVVGFNTQQLQWTIEDTKAHLVAAGDDPSKLPAAEAMLARLEHGIGKMRDGALYYVRDWTPPADMDSDIEDCVRREAQTRGMFFESVVINAIIQHCFETLRGKQAQMPRSWAVPFWIEYAVTPRALLPTDKHRAADEGGEGIEQQRGTISPDEGRPDTPSNNDSLFSLRPAASIAGFASYLQHAATETNRPQRQQQRVVPLSDNTDFLPLTWHKRFGPLRLPRAVAVR